MRAIFTAMVLAVACATQAGFPFDPDGPNGPRQPIQIGAFDFLVGNSCAKGIDSPVWTLYYQASVGTLTDEQGNPIPPAVTGLNVEHEITVVAAISVRTSQPPPFLAFELEPASTNFIRIYHDNQVNANPLEGTGYSDGTLILESHATDDLEGMLFIMSRTEDLDRFGSGNQWPGTKTLHTLGAFQSSSVVSSFDRGYFQVSGEIDRININSSQATPFRSIDPSRLFWNGSGTFAPIVGPVNVKGADAVIQADANASFRVR